MTLEELQERAKKGDIIERIVMRLEDFNYPLSEDRRARLQNMSLLELERLTHDLNHVSTVRDASNLVVKAFTDSEREKRAADDRRLNEICPPARVDMDL